MNGWSDVSAFYVFTFLNQLVSHSFVKEKHNGRDSQVLLPTLSQHEDRREANGLVYLGCR